MREPKVVKEAAHRQPAGGIHHANSNKSFPHSGEGGPHLQGPHGDDGGGGDQGSGLCKGPARQNRKESEEGGLVGRGQGMPGKGAQVDKLRASVSARDVLR